MKEHFKRTPRIKVLTDYKIKILMPAIILADLLRKSQ